MIETIKKETLAKITEFLDINNLKYDVHINEGHNFFIITIDHRIINSVECSIFRKDEIEISVCRRNYYYQLYDNLEDFFKSIKRTLKRTKENG